MCYSDRYFIHVEPYCGSDINIEESGLGQRPDVVLRLIDKCKLPKKSIVTFDKLLLHKLSEDSIYALRTIWENWLQGATLMEKSDLQKKERRAYDQVSDGENIAIAGRDNKAVIIATNYLSH